MEVVGRLEVAVAASRVAVDWDMVAVEAIKEEV